MSGETDRPSSRDVAHEAEDTRAHLASTLEQLRANLRPENVIDEVMSNARAGAASVADNLAEVAKANPLPSILVAAGVFVAMGVVSRGSRRRASAGKLPRAHLLDESRTFPSRAEPGAPSGAPRLDPGWTEDIANGGEDPKAGLASVADRLKRRATEAYEASTSDARETAQTLSHYVPRNRREVRSRLSNLLDDQPLILGAIGLAVGAAIGAALPITETEDHLMGGPSHQVRQAASEVARHEVQGLRAVAGEALGNIRKTAAEHGVSAENLNDLVKDVGAERLPIF